MIRKTLLGLLAAVVVLLVVLSVRAVRMPSLQDPVREAADPAGEPGAVLDAQAAAERLAGAIRFPTITNEDAADTDTAAFLELHAYLERSYPLVHAALARETVGDLSLLYTWEGTDAELDPVVLMGHLDVVPVIAGTEGDWTHPPFDSVVADGAVWGRGTMDDKVSVIAILEAVEGLLAEGYRPRRTVHLAFGHDEERGGTRGARAIAELLASRGAEPYALVLDEGGAMTKGMIPGVEGIVAVVGVAEKGYVNLELRVDGEGGHSSAPPAQTNIGILAEAISELEEHPFPARLEGSTRGMIEHVAPEMGFVPRLALANLWLFEPVVVRLLAGSQESAPMVRTTTAATIVQGGVKANVLPITARAVVNFRILPGDTKESVLARVQEVIDDERVQVRIHGDESVDPSPVSDATGPAFRLLATTIRRLVPDEEVVVTPYLVGGGTDAKWYSGRSPAVFRFLAVVAEPDALGRVHGTDEHLPVEGLATSIRFMREVIRGADGLE